MYIACIFQPPIGKKAPVPEGGVELALAPEELELDAEAMKVRYEQQMREQQSLEKEDLSDMVAEHAARQKVQQWSLFADRSS